MADETPPLERQWYWDRRTNKAYYPVAVDEETVQFATVWHRDEVDGALAEGAMTSVDDVTSDYTETTFDLLDSFRTPRVENLAAPGGEDDA